MNLFDSLFIFKVHPNHVMANKSKKQRVKKEIIAEHENGVCVSDPGSKYSIPKSTISTFFKNKEMIKAANVAKGSKVISKQRPQIIEEVDKLLFVYLMRNS